MSAEEIWDPRERSRLGEGYRPWLRMHGSYEWLRTFTAIETLGAEAPPSRDPSFLALARAFDAFRATVGSSMHQAIRLVTLESRVASMEAQLRELAAVRVTRSIFIDVAVHECVSVRSPFHVVVSGSGDDFVATHFEAGISSGGETEQEAVSNTVDLILETFVMLSELALEQLGPEPKRQLEVLQHYLQAR